MWHHGQNYAEVQHSCLEYELSEDFLTKSLSKKSARHQRILDVLEINPTIRVNALATDLGVSTETVRRDLAELDKTGRIRRTYGGAVRTKTFEPALAERLKLHVQERERIARHAVTLLADVRSLFIGGGATTMHFARALRSVDHPLTVLTPSLSIAMELASNPLSRSCRFRAWSSRMKGWSTARRP
jgi:DeoR/GlpR family transcriptional regulator of sugar metabolism